MSKRVRTLLRVSSRQQLHDDDIPLQRAELLAYIAGQPEWEFDGEYMEKAVSAYKNTIDERIVLLDILEDAKKGEFDILLAYMSDRIGRKEEYSTYVATLNSVGIQVWTIKDGQLKTQEHVDKLLNFIRFWQNEGESDKTSKRVRDTRAELIKTGKFLGGRAPFGYQLVPSGLVSNHGRLIKELVIDEKQAEIVRKIYDLAVIQGMGYERIAKTLNAEKLPALNAQQWRASTIAGILKNPVYMGYPCINKRVHNGKSTRQESKEWQWTEQQVEGLVIVPINQWQQAQKIREKRAAKMRHDNTEAAIGTKGNLLLSGLVYCGYCGKRLKNGSYCNQWMTKSGERKFSYVGRYVCPQKCKEKNCYAQKYLEQAVVDTVEQYLAQLGDLGVSELLKEKSLKKYGRMEKWYRCNHAKWKSLQQDIHTLEGKIPEAMRGEGVFDEEKLAALLQEKQEELCRLLKETRQIEDELLKEKQLLKQSPKVVTDWKELFREADDGTKKMILSAMIAKIIVRDEEVTIKFKVS